jgi:predicted permease
MINALAIVSQIFLLIGFGYLAVRIGYLSANWLAALGGFVLRVSLPALLFRSLAQHEITVASGAYLGAYAAGSLLLLALACVWLRAVRKQPWETAAISAMGMCCSNSAFIGYPVASQVVGAAAAVALSLCAVVENTIVIPVSLALADSASARHEPFLHALGRALLRLRSNPLIIGTAAGVAFSLLHLHLPLPVAKAVDLAAAAAVPVALISVGGMLVGRHLGSMLRDAAEIAVGKLVFHPCLIAVAFLAIGPGDMAMRRAAVVFAASPMMSIYPILGSLHQREQACAAALLGTTLAYFLTIGPVLWVVQSRWLFGPWG